MKLFLPCLLFALFMGAITCAAASVTIIVDDTSSGRTFDGIGAVSAGASSKLLIDYPEPQRSQILDYLFKPNYGAAFQRLKVEVGGDVNSTDGIEPSHMHFRNDENYNRGYEWWLMKEAKKRNPKIELDILPWGAPGWIGNGNYCSQDMCDYMVKFINGAREHHGLDIEYIGLWNEVRFDWPTYTKMLRKTLDANGLKQVKIVAADNFKWCFVNEFMEKDPELKACVYAVGDHYPRMQSTPEAKNCGKPIWSSEDGPWRGDWFTVTRDADFEKVKIPLPMSYNRNYIMGKITNTQIWSPVTSYYDNLPIPGSGNMRANTPWSGAYEIQPALWQTAHTTQFTDIGWKYMDSACLLLPEGGSVVALKSPDGKDFSIIIETMDATIAHNIEFKIVGGLSDKPLHVWESSPDTQFVNKADVKPSKGAFNFKAEANRVYSLTTTTGQGKGTAVSPPAKPFPTPYKEDFESYGSGETPKYWMDQAGCFETVKRADGKGMALRQIIPHKGIEWGAAKDWNPLTVMGSLDWRNYEINADVMIEDAGEVYLYGRCTGKPMKASPINGFYFKVEHDGDWEICTEKDSIAHGRRPFPANTWHNIKLAFNENEVSAFIDGDRVKVVETDAYLNGMVGLGSGWNRVQFDDVSIDVKPNPVNLALGKKATSSSDWDSGFSAALITDGNHGSRWNSAVGRSAGEWVEIDLGVPTSFNTVSIRQFEERVTGYKVQYWDGVNWADTCTGGKMTASVFAKFNPVTSDKIRILITESIGTPSLFEVEVYNLDR